MLSGSPRNSCTSGAPSWRRRARTPCTSTSGAEAPAVTPIRWWLFSLDESIYGWVRKPNSHPFFAGRSAMEVMQGGRVADLYEVATRLHAWRGEMA